MPRGWSAETQDERTDAHALATTAMESVVHREDPPRDALEAANNLTDAIVWLAAETRAARLDRRMEVGA